MAITGNCPHRERRKRIKKTPYRKARVFYFWGTCDLRLPTIQSKKAGQNPAFSVFVKRLAYVPSKISQEKRTPIARGGATNAPCERTLAPSGAWLDSGVARIPVSAYSSNKLLTKSVAV